MTKFFKGKSKKLAEVSKEQPPREMKDIQAAYNELRARAGDLQYQVFVLEKDLSQINQALISVNHEAAARQKLDKDSEQTTQSQVAQQ
jgi:hypothetical protein